MSRSCATYVSAPVARRSRRDQSGSERIRLDPAQSGLDKLQHGYKTQSKLGQGRRQASFVPSESTQKRERRQDAAKSRIEPWISRMARIRDQFRRRWLNPLNPGHPWFCSVLSFFAEPYPSTHPCWQNLQAKKRDQAERWRQKYVSVLYFCLHFSAISFSVGEKRSPRNDGQRNKKKKSLSYSFDHHSLDCSSGFIPLMAAGRAVALFLGANRQRRVIGPYGLIRVNPTQSGLNKVKQGCINKARPPPTSPTPGALRFAWTAPRAPKPERLGLNPA